MAIFRLGDFVPHVSPSAWVADNAQVIGQVTLEDDASIWYSAVLRGDNDRIHIGARSNVQDGSVLHVDAGVPMHLGNDVTVGHQVMLHGCTIGDCTLIGIQSVVMNHVRIGRNSIVGAGSLVTEGKEFPDGVLIVGSPARVVRELTPEQQSRLQLMAAHYIERQRLHRSQLQRIA
ncbi:gamma carbonic anhydrase family protein [Aquabacterium sp.]|uniref:gamma carbonic anhydrase family protein n=1 Tax=Aquabacterium sp. TaxID=1872578 RepID=UPI003783F285